MEQIVEHIYLGNSLYLWLVALGTAVATFFILKLLQRLVRRRLAAVVKRTTTNLDDMIVEVLSNTKLLFLLLVSVYAGAQILTLSPMLQRVLDRLTILVVLLQAAFWATGAVAFWLKQMIAKRTEEDAAAATSLSALGFLIKLAVWSVALLLALDNMGINITSLVAGIGIGGIAVALAVQKILGDLFASLSIVLDKPFVIGDFIIVGDLMGTVEHIGLKTTRVRSLSGEQIIFPNSDLLQSRIRNYKRMQERRVLFTIGVTYQTPYETIQTIGATLRQIIEAQSHARFDRAHFKEYGDSALIFEVVYYVTTPDYNLYMDVQQQINLEIYRRFQDAGIEFAYPTRTLYLQQESTVVTASGRVPHELSEELAEIHRRKNL
jgi:small-conductance mechanosensitive channel